jgi:hypothetical protein
MPYISKTRTPYRTLTFKGEYSNVHEFNEKNKEKIYYTIINVFEGFKDNKKRKLSLYIHSIIGYLEWDIEYIFLRNNTTVLMTKILPYFEDIEEYEICQDIIDLNNYLTNNVG